LTPAKRTTANAQEVMLFQLIFLALSRWQIHFKVVVEKNPPIFCVSHEEKQAEKGENIDATDKALY